MENKKSVSPVISTVLLIMIVIIIAIIILLWYKGFTKELIAKEVLGVEKRVNEFCNEVSITPLKNEDGSFGFSNKGSIPIYAISLKTETGGSSSVVKIINEKGEGSMNPGSSFIIDITESKEYESFDSVKIIPILLGRTESGDVKEFQCPEATGLFI